MYHTDNNSRSSTQRSQLSHFTIIQDSPFGQKEDSTFTGTCLAASLTQAKLRHIQWWVWLSWASRHVPCVGPPQSSQPASQLNPPLERSPKPFKMLPTGSASCCWGAWRSVHLQRRVGIAQTWCSHLELLAAETSAYLVNPTEQCKEIHNTQETEVNVTHVSSCSCLNPCPNPTTPVLVILQSTGILNIN